LAKRISDIAKELGIQSKAIIDKCLAEGIPADKVKSHTSTLSAGLEATIREWFSAAGTGTAVETAAHVDVEQIRATAKRSRTTSKAKASQRAESTGDAGGSVATVDAPAEVSKPPRRPVAKPTPAREEKAEVETITTVASGAAPAPVAAAPAAPPAPAAPVSTRPVTTDAPPAAPRKVEPPIDRGPVKPAAPSAEPKPVRPGEAERGGGSAAAPSAPHHPAPPTHPGHPSHPPAGPARVPTVIRPAPMNVPQRPTVVAPAGPKLEARQAVKLSGPKVVRIEAPDVVDRPRPRRDDGGPGRTDDRRQVGGAGAGARRKSPELGDRAGVPARRRGVSGEENMHSGMWREKDLAEREARLSRATGFLKARRQQLRRQAGSTGGERAASAAQTGGVVHISEPFTIKDLSAATGVKAAEIIKKLLLQHNVMANANSGIDSLKAQEIMADWNIELVVEEAKSAEQAVSEKFTGREMVDQRSRGPIVTILGHVDHGKTSLLDRIRNANVAAGEAGGITQATSAFRTPVKIGGETKHIIFLDTPGHEAFTAMRARGASITDIVVLVVSAPEGVMPQTIESINHARAAKVPIVVALNKIDRPDATEARVNQTLGELAAQGLNPVEWGGDTEVIRTSATTGEGIDKLLEVLDLQGQLLDLKADYGGPARGTVVEARREEGRGPVANVIVQDGQLKVGDFIVLGRAFGRVRDIVDDRGQRHKSVGPAMVVQISGFDELPNAGDKFYIVDSLREAEAAAQQRRERDREAQLAQPKVTLDTLLSQMKDSEVKEILIVLKADVQGSVDVLKHEIERVKTDEVKARVLHAAVGGIVESDVLLADASKAVIIGFNVIPSGKARNLAEQKGVEIRTYQVIYEITDDIKKAAEGLLAPEMKTQILGHAEVRQVFKISKVGTIAGCYVTDGMVQRDAFIRVTRNGIVIENDRKLEQLKRFKDDAKEVKMGMECGMKIIGYDDIKEGDVLECYKTVEVKRTL
jgi:translation initiation factor IF-2